MYNIFWRYIMRKLLATLLVLALALSSAFMFTACAPRDDGEPEAPATGIVGVYEMFEISGTITTGGQTIPLEEGLYEYYIIEIKEGGVATVKSAAAGSSSEIRQDVTWEYDEATGALDIISVIDGMTIVEKMTLKDGIIEYKNSQTGLVQGVQMTMDMTIKLSKKS